VNLAPYFRSHQNLHLPVMSECCVIIPCYNESDRLLVDEFREFIHSHPDYRFLFVNDGSSDHTLDVLQKLAALSPRMHVLSLSQNAGKAAAVRAGMMEALKSFDSAYFAFLDADLAIPLEELERLVKLSKASGSCKFSFMAKVPKKGAVDQPFKRFVMGRTLAAITRMSLRLPVYDTQCGCKLFSRDIIEVVMGEPFISPWLFDIEMFHRLIRKYGREWFREHALEVPLEQLIERGGSRISGRHLLKLPGELWTIHRTYSGK
jgi:glycosyltransferase involved in cell wall biosynthesis